MLKEYTAAQLFLLFTFLAALLPLVVGLKSYKRIKPEYKVLVWLVLITFIMDGVSTFFWLKKMNNTFISNFHTLIQFLLISYIYQIHFKGFIKKNTIAIINVAFTSVWLINMMFGQGFFLMNTYTKTLESIILIIFSLNSFYQFARELKVERLGSNPMFWFSSGILIYFSSNIFIFILNNVVLEYSKDFYVFIWAIHNIFSILFWIICTLTLWLSTKK